MRAVVTGGARGIGKQTAVALAKMDWEVVITSRNMDFGNKAASEMPGRVSCLSLDLAVPDAGSEFRRRLEQRMDGLDVLVNNAGLVSHAYQENSEGIELNLAVNALGPYRLTHALAPLLARGQRRRVVNVTGGTPFGSLNVDDLNRIEAFEGLYSYSQSKRVLHALSIDLAEELSPQGINVAVVYPGSASTSMTQGMSLSDFPWWMRPLYPLFKLKNRPDGGKSAERAAQSSIWAATTDELDGITGRYYDTHCREQPFSEEESSVDNRATIRRLLGI